LEVEALVHLASGQRFEAVAEVRGAAPEPPAFAVYADWEVGNPAHRTRFEETRRELFNVRAEHIESFICDFLLRRLDQPGHYTVIGLYGDEEGLRMCRSHPAVERFAGAHPVSEMTAKDLTGLRFYRVESAAPPLTLQRVSPCV